MASQSGGPPAGAGNVIGAKLRARRKDIGRTLQQVADESGLTVGFLSQIERGLSTPSLTSLFAIAKALQASVESFIAERLEPPTDREVVVTHAGTRQRYGMNDTRRIYEYLGRGFPGAKLNACLSHIAPGTSSETVTHDGEDFVYLLQGTMIYVVGGTEHRLEAGDTLHFPSSLPHGCRNIGADEAIELWVGTMQLFPR